MSEKKYVCNQAKIECQMCTNPQGTLLVTSNMVKLQGKFWATEKDKEKTNLIFQGTCKQSPHQAVPCVAVIQTSQWQGTGDISIQGSKPLLESSTIMCNYGGATIKIKDDLQKSQPSSLSPTAVDGITPDKPVSKSIASSSLSSNGGNVDTIVESGNTSDAIGYVETGYWTDENSKKIKEAKIGDKVRFYIKTKNIKNESLDLKLKDWDGKLNIDDSPKGAPKNIHIKNNLEYVEFTIPKEWEGDIEDDYGNEIELYFEINYKGKTYELPKSTDDYLIVYEKEVLITVLIELPHSYYSLGRAARNLDKGEAISALGLAGHSAMAIGDRYFDYGPDYRQTIVSENKYDYDFNDDGDKSDNIDLTARDKNGRPLYTIDETFAPGRPWWGEVIARRLGIKVENVDLNQALDFINLDWKKERTNIYGEVHKIEFYAKESEANKMLEWWEERYKHLKLYSVYPWEGEQCTTTVKTAIQQAYPLFKLKAINIIPDITQKPSGLLEELKKFVSSSRQHFGEKVKHTIIKPEANNFP